MAVEYWAKLPEEGIINIDVIAAVFDHRPAIKFLVPIVDELLSATLSNDQDLLLLPA